MRSNFLIYIVMLKTIWFGSVSPLQCYNCTPTQQGGDECMGTNQVCPEGGSLCYKSYWELKVAEDGTEEVRVARGCVKDISYTETSCKVNPPLSKGQGKQLGRSVYCTCNTDGCNSATFLKYQMAMLLLSFLVVIAFQAL